MGWLRVTALVVVAACSFQGNAIMDGSPDRPDADPNRPDADLTHPDAMVVPDAPPGTPDAPPDQPDAMVPQCPGGYAPILIAGVPTSSSYRFIGTTSTWGAAEADCEDDAGPTNVPTHLAVVDDSAERAALVAPPGASNEWIGYTDLAAEGTFAFVTPQAGVLSGSASGNAAMKDCVRLQSATTYQARDCNEANVYVCECDGFAAEAARYPNLPNGN